VDGLATEDKFAIRLIRDDFDANLSHRNAWKGDHPEREPSELILGIVKKRDGSWNTFDRSKVVPVVGVHVIRFAPEEMQPWICEDRVLGLGDVDRKTKLRGTPRPSAVISEEVCADKCSGAPRQLSQMVEPTSTAWVDNQDATWPIHRVHIAAVFE